MRLSLVSVLVFVGSVLAQSSTADSYASIESPIAKAGVLANIGSSGSKSEGAKARNLNRVERYLCL